MLRSFICCPSDSGLGAPTGHGGSVHSSSSRRDNNDGGSPRKLNLDGLPHFEKNFYSESPEVRAMTEADVDEYRKKREITVEGRDVPKPVKSFHDVGFPGNMFLLFFFCLINFPPSPALGGWELGTPSVSTWCFSIL